MSKQRKSKPRTPKSRNPKQPRLGGTHVIYPLGVQKRLGCSAPTRWRMEKDGRLPPRDVHIGGIPVGWKPETLAAAERGESAAA